MRCTHLNPKGYPEPNTEREMSDMAKIHKRFDVKWGVVNGGNALCADVFDTKEQAEAYRKARAKAYSVVKVCITPLYQQDDK